MKATDVVAYNLKKIRTKNLISQENLAIDAGVARTYVSRIERGLENCTIGVLEKIAMVLNCNIRDFFDDPDGRDIVPLKAGRKPK